MHQLLHEAASRAARYLESLDHRRVAPSADAVGRLRAFYEQVPAGPCPPESVLAMLDDIGSDGTVATAGPRFFGFVIGGTVPAALAATMLSAAWDQNPGLFIASPTAAVLEEVALGWLVDVLNLPLGTAAGFVTGATMANFTALAAARHAVFTALGWDIEGNGLIGAPPIQIVVGEDVHPSVIKALGLLGLGRQRVTRVAVDDQGRMRPDAIPALDKTSIVCIQAGNVNSGAFDPAAEIISRAHNAGAWVHVDGAFGLWAAASPRFAHLVDGFGEADSWATDAHKWLNVPYDSGIAFVRNPEHLRAAVSLVAAYLPPSERRDPSHFTPELSRRARGVEVWAALKSLGRSGLADLIDRNCAAARRFAEGLSQAGYPILNDVVLNQVVVSFGDAARNHAVIQGIQEEGTCWCGPTHWKGHDAMRISVSSWATNDEDVEKSLKAILAVAAR